MAKFSSWFNVLPHIPLYREETEALRGKVTCPRSPSKTLAKYIIQPGLQSGTLPAYSSRHSAVGLGLDPCSEGRVAYPLVKVDWNKLHKEVYLQEGADPLVI